MGEKLIDGREIVCPMGRTGHCGTGVLCTVEGTVLEVSGPQSDPRSIEQFCTKDCVACPTYQMFAEFRTNQLDTAERVRKALDGQEDSDAEILEEIGALEEK